MEATVDSITLSYLDKLPLLFAPIPSLSSISTHSLASKRPGLAQNELWTKCNTCRAEIVGGINGSYWTESGSLWLRCEGCRTVTRRIQDSMNSNGQAPRGKAAFESCKKRRKLEAKRARDAACHPTAFSSHTTTLPQPLTTTKRPNPEVSISKKVMRDATRAETPPKLTGPTTSRERPTLAPKPAIASPSMSTAKRPGSTPTSTSTSASPAPLPPPTSTASVPSKDSTTSLDSKLASKKRKRPKQPSGLAELLAKKKQDQGASGGAGLGLQDFLQGL
ncbi:uncharacterized protein JCM15063_002102 [Sporobolomyces koalae]|uniref:uncharacterized protein n=1 Tax=Sporobolomyces koalae TaxID=500713 RepID=UPI00317ABC11